MGRCACLVLLVALTACVRADVTLVDDGRPVAAIYHAADAPATVRQAAEELQRVVQVATGAKLPIVHEPTSPMISLGAHPTFSAADMPDDGYRIFTAGDNVYIVGKDVLEPRWQTWNSRGTMYGTFDFLERVADVRWLLPGEAGEDIPRTASLAAPEMDITQAPDFTIRSLVQTGDRAHPRTQRQQTVTQWLMHHRAGSTQMDGRKIYHSHWWPIFMPQDVLDAHPDWRAVNGDRLKFCTSNEDAVAAFVEAVRAFIDKRPDRRFVSISPSDGANFCHCDRCEALVTKDPYGRRCTTPLVFKFYREVAARIAESHPDHRLAGYAYNNYMYPPPDTQPLPDNFWIVWAPLNYYGWGLIKPVYRDEIASVAARWGELSGDWMYHNYSTWMRSFNGAPMPIGVDILKLELPTVHRAGAKGAEIVGHNGWGYGAPSNYVLAKQMWDVDSDVDALLSEWFTRAYGPAADTMRQLFDLIERKMIEDKLAERVEYHGEQYEVNAPRIKVVWLPIFDQLEQLYFTALGEAATDPQRRRIAMMGDNLTLLHGYMRRYGMLDNPQASRFYLDDEAFDRFVADNTDNIAVTANLQPIWEKQWSRQ